MIDRQKQRLAWVDISKGIGIVLVVLGHVVRGLVADGSIPKTSESFQWFDFALYTFHMPLFFFLSGLMAEKSLKKGNKPFFISKLWTIVYPYFLWSILLGVTLLAVGGTSAADVTPLKLLEIPVYPTMVFWFLYALFICHVIFAFWPQDKRPYLVLVTAIALVVVEFIPDQMKSVWPPFFHVVHAMVFYLAGHYFVRFSDRIRFNVVTMLGLLVCFLLAVVGAHFLVGWKYLSIAAIPAGLLGVGTVIALSQCISGYMAAATALLGTASMTIYVTHTVICSIVRKVLHVAHVPVAVQVVTGLLAGLLVPLVGHILLKRLGWLHYFGLAAPKPKPSLSDKVKTV